MTAIIEAAMATAISHVDDDEHIVVVLSGHKKIMRIRGVTLVARSCETGVLYGALESRFPFTSLSRKLHCLRAFTSKATLSFFSSGRVVVNARSEALGAGALSEHLDEKEYRVTNVFARCELPRDLIARLKKAGKRDWRRPSVRRVTTPAAQVDLYSNSRFCTVKARSVAAAKHALESLEY